MTFLTSFSYELIVVCKHKLCLGSLLSLCLIRSSSFAQCFLEEESEAQVTNWSSSWFGVFLFVPPPLPSGNSQCNLFAKVPTYIENQQTKLVLESETRWNSYWHYSTSVEYSALRTASVFSSFPRHWGTVSVLVLKLTREEHIYNFCNKILQNGEHLSSLLFRGYCENQL